MSKALKKLLRVLEVSVSNKGEAHTLTVGHMRNLVRVALRNGEPPELPKSIKPVYRSPSAMTRSCEYGRFGELSLDESAFFILLDIEYLEDRYDSIVMGGGHVYVAPEVRTNLLTSLSHQIDISYEKFDKIVEAINNRN